MRRIGKKRIIEELLLSIAKNQEHPGRADFKSVYGDLMRKYDDETAAVIINYGIKKKKIRHTLDNRLVVVVVPL